MALTIADAGSGSPERSLDARAGVVVLQSAVGNRQLAIGMSRTSIIALLIFGAILGYFLSFGPESTRQISGGRLSTDRAVFDQRVRFAKTDYVGANGLKSLDELERDNANLQVENRRLRRRTRRCGTWSMKSIV